MERLNLFRRGGLMRRRSCGAVAIRPLNRHDEAAWLALADRNSDWLRPWEATLPSGDAPHVTFGSFLSKERTAFMDGVAFAVGIEFEGALVGRAAIAQIRWDSLRSGNGGYWVDRAFTGRGIAPAAMAMLVDYGFSRGLHRVELAIRPDNFASLRVAEKLGFRSEGIRPSAQYVDGAWRDHLIFALTADEPRVGAPWKCASADNV